MNTSFSNPARRQVALLGLAAALLAGLPAGAAEGPAPARRVLFVGNSFTYVNDLPAMFTQLAQAGGQPAPVCVKETPGGCTFEQHWKSGKALKAIQSRKWDVVVLQENSNLPARNKAAMFEYARLLHAAVTNQGAQALLFMTWSWPTPKDQPAITAAYQELARELPARLAPVGAAWDATLKAHPSIRLFAKDNHHPSPAGTYLAACVFYAVIYGRSPVGLPCSVKGLKETDTRALQSQAWAAARQYQIRIPPGPAARQ